MHGVADRLRRAETGRRYRLVVVAGNATVLGAVGRCRGFGGISDSRDTTLDGRCCRSEPILSYGLRQGSDER